LTNENAVQSNALRFEKDCAGELRANLSAESAGWYSHSQTQQHRIAALEKEMTAFETRDRRKDEIVMAHEREKVARHVQIEHHAQLVMSKRERERERENERERERVINTQLYRPSDL